MQSETSRREILGVLEALEALEVFRNLNIVNEHCLLQVFFQQSSVETNSYYSAVKKYSSKLTHKTLDQIISRLRVYSPL